MRVRLEGVTDREKNEILDILNHPNGWSKFFPGFVFESTKKSPDVTITVVGEPDISAYCSIRNMSCSYLQDPLIYINKDRWDHGSRASRLSVRDYRRYVIGHEIGHTLGFGHIRPYGTGRGPCPIMVQQTRGIGDHTPYCFPIVDDFDAYEPSANQLFRGFIPDLAH